MLKKLTAVVQTLLDHLRPSSRDCHGRFGHQQSRTGEGVVEAIDGLRVAGASLQALDEGLADFSHDLGPRLEDVVLNDAAEDRTSSHLLGVLPCLLLTPQLL